MKRVVLPALLAGSLGGCLMHEHRDYTPGVTPVTKQEVIEMTASGSPEDQIIERIGENGVDHRATPDDLIEMKEAGVGSRVMAGFTEAPVTKHRPAVERRTRYYYDPSEDLINVGVGVLAGYLFWRHFRH